MLSVDGLHFSNPPCNITQEEEDEKLKALMSSYVTTTDAPAIFFVDEFCRLYPDSIVICSIRDLEKWWDSYQDLVKAVDGLMENVMQLFSSTERYTILWKLAIVKRYIYIYSI